MFHQRTFFTRCLHNSVPECRCMDKLFNGDQERPWVIDQHSRERVRSFFVLWIWSKVWNWTYFPCSNERLVINPTLLDRYSAKKDASSSKSHNSESSDVAQQTGSIGGSSRTLRGSSCPLLPLWCCTRASTCFDAADVYTSLVSEARKHGARMMNKTDSRRITDSSAASADSSKSVRWCACTSSMHIRQVYVSKQSNRA